MAWTTGTLVALAACGDGALPPHGQLLITVTTDAPLPPPPGESLAADDPLPLFDRLRVEVFRPGENTPCRECTNEFDVDRQLVAAGRASFGITPPVGAHGYVARVRLFSAAFVSGGEPRADATIDVTVALPATSAEGIEHVAVTMRTDDVAKRIGNRDAPLAAERGRARGALVGTWPRARRASCTGAPAPGEVCIRGGAFWMGSPRLRVLHEPGDAPVMRLVSLSPYFIGAREVTVGEMRASGLAAPRDPVLFQTQTNVNAAVRLECDYTEVPNNYDQLAVNCVSWEKAAAHCRAQGGDLPTEAQFQFVATAFGTTAYVWGDDAPSCEDAVYARAPVIPDPDRACPRGWVEKGGSARRDRLVVGPDQVVFDLAGNLSEYARDRWNLQGEDCWKPGVLVDPVCETPSTQPGAIDGAHTIVGGDWVNLGGRLAGASRRPSHPFEPFNAGKLTAEDIINVGFRCSRNGAQ